MRSSNALSQKKDVNSISVFSNSSIIDILKTPEQNIASIINDIVFLDQLSHLTDVNTMYKLLMKLPKFREFVLINEFEENFILELLRTGILHSYKLNEIIFTKEKYPNFYFLLLVGSVEYVHDKDTILKPGCFFGEEIIQQIRYKHTVKANSDKTVLLLVPKEYAILNMREKIILANEKLQQILEKSFDIFKTLGSSVVIKYLEKMSKIFPKMNEVIASNTDIADAIFLIYNGVFLLNKDTKEKLILVAKGDIIGTESLNNVGENGNILNNKYIYNIICKSRDAIIFKLYINEFNIKIINAINAQLELYSQKRHEFIKSKEKANYLMNKRLKNSYKIFQKKENINEYITHCTIKQFTPEQAELSFNNALKKIIIQNKFENDKQRITLRSSNFNKHNANKNNLFRKIYESKSYINLRESVKTKKSKIKHITNYSLINLVNKGNNITKKKIFDKYNKLFNNKEEKKEDQNNVISNLKNSDISNVLNNSSENTKNNTFFVTSVKQKEKEKEIIYKRIPINRIQKESKLFSSRLRTKNKLKEKFNFSEEYQNKIKSFISSTNNKNSFSYMNIHRLMSAKKQVENYGCTILDEINYFNFGDTEKNMKSSKKENKENTTKKKNNCIFYETNKFNIPLFIFCERKEKFNFPEII